MYLPFFFHLGVYFLIATAFLPSLKYERFYITLSNFISHLFCGGKYKLKVPADKILKVL